MFSPFEDYFILSICGLIELITSSNTSFYGSDGFHTAQHATLCICEQAEAFHIRIVPVLDDLNVWTIIPTNILLPAELFEINVPYVHTLRYPFVLEYPDARVGLSRVFFYIIYGDSDTLQQLMCVRMFENSTNISVMFVCIAFTLFTSLNFVRKELISSFNRVAYFVYYDMLLQYVGDAGKKYFAFPPYIFLFIPIGNVAGSIPHVFQLTGNLAVTLSPSSVSWLGVLLIGLYLHGIRFLTPFYPANTPRALAPIIMCLEIVSYVVRVASLALRLFANIIAGHILLDIASSFSYHVTATVTVGLSYQAVVWGAILLCPPIGMLIFEPMVAFAQAYIFVILSMIYLNEAIQLHM